MENLQKNNKNSDKNVKIILKNSKNTKSSNATQKFKEQYFAYYDDVKSHTHKIVDW